MNNQWSKRLLILEFAFETCILLVCFCNVWKDKSLLILYYTSDYLDQTLAWKETKEAFSCKAPDWKPLCLLKIKIKQDLGCPNKEYNVIFEYTQNIRAYTRAKKICTDQWLGKYYYLLGRIRPKQGVGEKVWFVPNKCCTVEKKMYALIKIRLFTFQT